MPELHYLYGFALSDCCVKNIDQAMDDRFPIERLPFPPIAAIASRVGRDRFDVSKLAEETADVNWLSQVAVRHNAIVDAIAQRHPILPLRLGTIFNSRTSLLERTAQCAAEVAEFLRRLEDRREWAVKLYLDQDQAGKGVAPTEPITRSHGDSCAAPPSTGLQYFVAKRREHDRRRQLDESVRQELLATESCLQGVADSWRRLRPLPATLTGRSEKMVWNATCLLSRSGQDCFRNTCERLRNHLHPQGLILEVTGPWAPYHFCPALAG